MTEQPTPQKYKQLQLVQLAALITFSGFNRIIQANLRVPRNQKGGKAISRTKQAVHTFFALYQT